MLQKIKPAALVMLQKGQADSQKNMIAEKNHSGSSKAIEASAAVELFTNVTKSNVKFSTYAGDDDSTTEPSLKAKGTIWCRKVE